jgi:hypothetical protein
MSLNDCERFKTANQHYYKFLLIQLNNFLYSNRLIINNVEIIACKLELFKKPLFDLLIKRSIAIVSAL